MHWTAAIVCGLIGFLAGGYLQTVVQRTPMRERVLGIGIHCMRCGNPSSGTQKAALLSYLTSNIKCRVCSARLWTTIPWLELITAALLAATGAKFGFAWALPAYLIGFSAFIAITVVDLRHYLIPNRILYPALFSCIVAFVAAALIESNPEALLHALIGMGIAWTFFVVVWLISPRGMGFGDVRLSMLVGLLTGWLGIGNTILGVVLGVFAGGLVGVVFVLLRFLTRKDSIPYGPFLVFGALMAIFWGTEISNWWLGTS